MRKALFVCFIIMLLMISCAERKFNNPVEPDVILDNLIPPDSLQINVVDENVLELTWEDKCDIEDSFQIFRKVGNSKFTFIKTMPTNSSTWQDNNVELGNTYSYQVFTTNEGYRSLNAAESSFVYNLYPPANLKIEAIDNNKIKLSWEDSNHFAEGYKIDKKLGDIAWHENFASASIDTNSWEYEISESDNSPIIWRVKSCYKSLYSANSDEVSLKVADPTFNVVSGTYTTTQHVVIACATSGAIIRYTTDGSTPTNSSTKYDGAISISENTKLKAKAFKSGWYDSETAINSYIINLPIVATPTFKPDGGTYSTNQYINISCATNDVTIRYTTDGSAPTATSTLYSDALHLNENTTLKAKAFKHDWNDSDVASTNYSFQVVTPTFSPSAGTYSSSQYVNIRCATSGAIIRYTTDGSIPTSSSTVYSSAIQINADTTLKAKAFRNNWTDSATATSSYVINLPTVATPKFNPDGGTYNNNQSVTISCATNGATIRYTTDGSTPTSASTVYSGAIPINMATTLKAKAFKYNWIDSNTASASYSFKVAMPTFKPAGGTYTTNQSVTISCTTSGATVRYTTNGSTPTSSSTLYSDAISISANTTLKAIAFKSGWTDSDTANAIYTLKVATPVISPAGGVVDSPQSVTINCATSGATIHYTTNGNTPTSNSTQYSGAISINTNTTLKAKAFKSGLTDSETASASYTFDMVYVPGGTFTMGDTRGAGDSNELPTHSVTLNSFYIGKYQVTQSEYQAIMDSNPSHGYGVGNNYPVYRVSWYDALKYCNLRSMNEGLSPVYSINGSTNPANWGVVPDYGDDDSTWSAAVCNWNANGYRLPTEAEWEYAARGGTNNPDYLYSGSNVIDNVAWYEGNCGIILHPVGGKAANGLGIYDMSGNVWEWCWDWWDTSYYSSSPSKNPTGPAAGLYRLERGGCWINISQLCRVAKRHYDIPTNRNGSTGFRVSRAIN